MGGIPEFCRLRWVGGWVLSNTASCWLSQSASSLPRAAAPCCPVAAQLGLCSCHWGILPSPTPPRCLPPYFPPSCSAVLAFGEDSAPLRENRFATVQGLSGTGSLRVGGEFLSRFYPGKKLVLIPNPSWANHRAIFERCGMEVQPYRWGFPLKGWEGMHLAVRAAASGVARCRAALAARGDVPVCPLTPSLCMPGYCWYCCTAAGTTSPRHVGSTTRWAAFGWPAYMLV